VENAVAEFARSATSTGQVFAVSTHLITAKIVILSPHDFMRLSKAFWLESLIRRGG
jgi:hypothetical protein